MSKMPVDDKVSEWYKIERLFLMYAYPCVDQRTKISDEEKARIKEGILRGEKYSREEIERFFPHAFEKMRIIYSDDPWLHVEDFWRGEGHNKSLELDHDDNKTETAKELCKVRNGKVKKDHGEYLELENGKKVLNPFGLRLNEGDVVRVHEACVIEKV